MTQNITLCQINKPPLGTFLVTEDTHGQHGQGSYRTYANRSSLLIMEKEKKLFPCMFCNIQVLEQLFVSAECDGFAVNTFSLTKLLHKSIPEELM